MPTGILGRPVILTNWETVKSGMNNPREDGSDNLDVDGDFLEGQNASICIPLRTSETPVSERDREIPASSPIPGNDDDDDYLPVLEIDGDLDIEPQVDLSGTPLVEMDNPTEAIVPPHPSDVPATRLSDFRCGGLRGGAD